MKLLSILVSLSSLILNDVFAYNIKRDQIFLYTQITPGSVIAQGNTLIIDADKASTSVTLDIPQNRLMYAIYRDCSPNTDWQSPNIKGFVGNIIALPKGLQTAENGLKYSLETNSWSPFPISSSSGYSFYITTDPAHWNNTEPASAGFHQCWPLGASVGLGSRTPALPVTITIDRGTAVPGVYTIKVPMYWSYIEWKIHGKDQPPINPGWPNLITNTGGSLMHMEFPVVITSSCNLQNSDAIQLDHGVMTPTSAINNVASSTVNLVCTNAATVNVKLLGNEMDNKSSCSSWGTCELTFDNGKYEDKLQITGAKTLTIRSTFKPKTSETVTAGKFSANGVLQILVE